MTEDEVKKDLKRFFEILNTKEVSDNEVTFSPVFISSVRVHLTRELSEILPRLQAYSETPNDPV